MREKIIKIFKDIYDSDTPWCSCYEGDMYNTFPQASNKAVDQIVSLIKEEMEKIENPFIGLPAGPVQEDAFEYFRKQVLTILV